jgi:hypothetical protein
LALFDLSRQLQRHDDAVELARRLARRASTPAEQQAAELRLAEALAASPSRLEALPHFVAYLKQRPDDEAVLQRFLRFALEIGRLRDAVSYLESRYNAASDEVQRRVMAERLGQFLDQDANQIPLAAEWYAKALGHDPLGAECGARLVSLWKGKEDRRLLALLEGMYLLLTERLRETPWRWDVYRRLSALFGWLENRARYHAIYDLAQASGLFSELPPATLPVLRPSGRALSESDLRALIPQARQTRELVVALREILPKSFPRSINEFNLGRRDRLREGPGAERRREVDALAARFGVSVYDAYIGGEPNACTALQSGSELIVLVGAARVAAPLPPEALFSLGRAFTAARNGLLPLLDVGPPVIEGIFRGMAWCADDKLRDKELPPLVQRSARAIYDNMTRGLRRSLAEQFTALTLRFPADLDELAQELLEEADRGGLLAAGSLSGALRGVADLPSAGSSGAPYRGAVEPASQGEEALRAMLSRPRALSLLQFSLSKEYEGLMASLSA